MARYPPGPESLTDLFGGDSTRQRPGLPSRLLSVAPPAMRAHLEIFRQLYDGMQRRDAGDPASIIVTRQLFALRSPIELLAKSLTGG